MHSPQRHAHAVADGCINQRIKQTNSELCNTATPPIKALKFNVVELNATGEGAEIANSLFMPDWWKGKFSDPRRDDAKARLRLAEKGYNAEGGRRPWYSLGVGSERIASDYHAVLGGIRRSKSDERERRDAGLWDDYNSWKTLGFNIRLNPEKFSEIVNGPNADIVANVFVGLAETVTFRTMETNAPKHAENEFLRSKNREQLKTQIDLEHFFQGKTIEPERLEELAQGAEISLRSDTNVAFKTQTKKEKQQEIQVRYEYLRHASDITKKDVRVNRSMARRIEDGIDLCMESAANLWPVPPNERNREKYLLERMGNAEPIDRSWIAEPYRASREFAENVRQEEQSRRSAVEKLYPTFFQDASKPILLYARYDGTDVLLNKDGEGRRGPVGPDLVFALWDFHPLIQNALINIAGTSLEKKNDDPSAQAYPPIPLLLQSRALEGNGNFLHPPDLEISFLSSAIAKPSENKSTLGPFPDISSLRYRASLENLEKSDKSNLSERLQKHTSLMHSFIMPSLKDRLQSFQSNSMGSLKNGNTEKTHSSDHRPRSR